MSWHSKNMAVIEIDKRLTVKRQYSSIVLTSLQMFHSQGQVKVRQDGKKRSPRPFTSRIFFSRKKLSFVKNCDLILCVEDEAEHTRQQMHSSCVWTKDRFGSFTHLLTHIVHIDKSRQSVLFKCYVCVSGVCIVRLFCFVYKKAICPFFASHQLIDSVLGFSSHLTLDNRLIPPGYEPKWILWFVFFYPRENCQCGVRTALAFVVNQNKECVYLPVDYHGTPPDLSLAAPTGRPALCSMCLSSDSSNKATGGQRLGMGDLDRPVGLPSAAYNGVTRSRNHTPVERNIMATKASLHHGTC